MDRDLLRALQRVVGDEHVLFGREEVELETRTCIPFRQIPDCVVYPESAAEVQAIVRLANEKNAQIWPVSTGKNWGYGEKSATYGGGITMVLERMRKIERVDGELGYALIEPGVTYGALNRHLKENGYPLWSDSAGTTESASVIGNALDKGRGLTPYADHFGCLCGMEVVLPDGSLLRTGNLTDRENQVWNLYKWGVGPYLDGLFAQSNFGIVVKAGIWLMPEPEAFDFLAFEYTSEIDRFPSMIDELRQLVFRGVLRSRPHIANDFAMLCIVSQYPRSPGSSSCLTLEELHEWRREHGVSPWTFGCGLYGSAAEVRSQRRILRKRLRRYGRLWSFGRATQDDWVGKSLFRATRLAARMSGKSDAFLDQLKPAANLFRGIPTNEFARQVYFRNGKEKPRGGFDPPKDRCGFMWIGPLVPFRSSSVDEALQAAREVFAAHGFDFFVEIIVESPRTLLILFGIFYERTDEIDEKRARGWYVALRHRMMEMGYPAYRESLVSAPHLFDANPATRRMLASMKQALDPGGILAPGRYGIG